MIHQAHSIHFSASAIVRDEDQNILLVKREDLRVWVLPGGMVDYGETLEQAARREAFEETGIEIEIDTLQGIYYLHLGRRTFLAFVYQAHPIGGAITTSFESVDVRYFPINRLPERVPLHVRQRIAEARAGRTNVLVEEHLPRWQRITLPYFFRLRNLRNRYLLGRPVPEATRFTADLTAYLNGDLVAQAAAVKAEPPWVTLQRAVQHQITDRVIPVGVEQVDMDVPARKACIKMAFDLA
ncbi:MAG: NUDIX domain-containing protein [Chloroflexi bacterium]|nr:NUDIX domain-containing protein [Chloroflexota bacterium]